MSQVRCTERAQRMRGKGHASGCLVIAPGPYRKYTRCHLPIVTKLEAPPQVRTTTHCRIWMGTTAKATTLDDARPSFIATMTIIITTPATTCGATSLSKNRPLSIICSHQSKHYCPILPSCLASSPPCHHHQLPSPTQQFMST